MTQQRQPGSTGAPGAQIAILGTGTAAATRGALWSSAGSAP
jgi:hypothetical protein